MMGGGFGAGRCGVVGDCHPVAMLRTGCRPRAGRLATIWWEGLLCPLPSDAGSAV